MAGTRQSAKAPGHNVSFAALCQHLDEVGLRADLGGIAMDHHATLFQVLTGSRLKQVVEARAACCKHLRAKGMSYPAIAGFLNLDQSSARTACLKP